MGIPDHITCLLKNLYACKEATFRTRHGTIDWFKIGKGVCEGSLLSPCLFHLYAEYIIDLDYCDIEWFALETNRDHSVVFETASKYCILDSFVDYNGYSISSKGVLSTVVGHLS